MSGRNNNLVKERMRMEDSVGKKSNKYYKRLDTLLFFSMLYVLLLTIFEEFHY